MPAAPLNADLMKSAAVQFPTDESVPLQLNIFNKDSRRFDIVSEVSVTDVESEHQLLHMLLSRVCKFLNCKKCTLQNGEVSYHLHKVKIFSPFSAAEWHLSDSVDTSPGTIIIRKSLFASHVSFERRDGTLIADMGARLLMTGSEFCWGGRVYR